MSQKIDGKIQVTLIKNWPAHRIAIFESYMIYENDMIYDKSHYLIDIYLGPTAPGVYGWTHEVFIDGDCVPKSFFPWIRWLGCLENMFSCRKIVRVSKQLYEGSRKTNILTVPVSLDMPEWKTIFWQDKKGIQHDNIWLPSMELTYPTWRKGKSSSKVPFFLGEDMLVPRRVTVQ